MRIIPLNVRKKFFDFRLDYGIGLSRFDFLLLKLGLPLNQSVKFFFKSLTNIIKRYKLILLIKKWILVRKLRQRNKQYLILFNVVCNYKSLRFRYGLPANGQRTHTNRKNSFRGLKFVTDKDALFKNNKKFKFFRKRKKGRGYSKFKFNFKFKRKFKHKYKKKK